MKKFHIGCAVLLVLMDQFVKFTMLYLPDMKVFPWLNITTRLNKGMAFSFFSQMHIPYQQYVMGVLTCLIVFFVVRYYRGFVLHPWLKVLVIAGGLSNAIDRFLYRGVVDFIDVHIQSYHWFVFNGADMMISCAILWLLFEYGFSSMHTQRK